MSEAPSRKRRMSSELLDLSNDGYSQFTGSLRRDQSTVARGTIFMQSSSSKSPTEMYLVVVLPREVSLLVQIAPCFCKKSFHMFAVVEICCRKMKVFSAAHTSPITTFYWLLHFSRRLTLYVPVCKCCT